MSFYLKLLFEFQYKIYPEHNPHRQLIKNKNTKTLWV